jgi:hypothetical protein
MMRLATEPNGEDSEGRAAFPTRAAGSTLAARLISARFS